MYFVTICVKDRIELLGEINEKLNCIKLTKEGNATNQNINKIGIIYNNVIIDEYVIMPNHNT